MKGWSLVKYIGICIAVLIGFIVIAGLGLFLHLIIGMRPIRADISGRVTDAAGKPMAGVEVKAITLPVYSSISDHEINTGCEPYYKTYTDVGGCFKFERLLSSAQEAMDIGRYLQEYDIVVNAQGYSPQKIRYRQASNSRWQSATLPDFKLEYEAFISGRIVDTKGRVCANRSIRLVLVKKQDQSPFVVQKVVPEYTQTDGMGGFEFTKVPSGTYWMEAEVFPERGFEATQRSQYGPLVVKAGQSITNLEFVFESHEDRGGISIRAVEALSGKQIETFIVHVKHVEIAGEGSGVCGFYTENGQKLPFTPYRKAQVNNGTLLVESVSAGMATVEISSAGYADTITYLKVESGTIGEAVIRIEKEGVIRGRVSINGNPNAYATVLARNARSETDDFMDVHSDQAGLYEYRSLPEGEYIVRCYANQGTHPYSVQLVNTLRSKVEFGKTTQLNFEFVSNATIKGSFSAPDKKLQWKVKIIDASEDASIDESYKVRAWAWKLERSGEYVIECLLPGKYKVVGMCYDKSGTSVVMEKSRTVTVGQGQTAQVDFAFP